MQINRDVHPSRRQGQRDVEAMGGEQFIAPDQGNRLTKPVLGSVEKSMLRVGPAEGMQGRYGNEQVAELQRAQYQHNRPAIFRRIEHCSRLLVLEKVP
jgi:hypothetical protein